MTALLDQVREAARTVLLKWPIKNDDAQKSNRAFAAYDLGFLPLRQIYKRADVLKILDYQKRQMFGASERHIRRVETIREAQTEKAVILERVAKAGSLSLETVEHLVIKPTIADVIETLYLCSPSSEQAEFLRRIGRR
jgi:hypothetical protein